MYTWTGSMLKQTRDKNGLPSGRLSTPPCLPLGVPSHPSSFALAPSPPSFYCTVTFRAALSQPSRDAIQSSSTRDNDERIWPNCLSLFLCLSVSLCLCLCLCTSLTLSL